jgi:hypothetical protein
VLEPGLQLSTNSAGCFTLELGAVGTKSDINLVRERDLLGLLSGECGGAVQSVYLWWTDLTRPGSDDSVALIPQKGQAVNETALLSLDLNLEAFPDSGSYRLVVVSSR